MKSNVYKTKDQFIASCLYSLGVKLESTERVQGTCFFVFEDQSACEQLVKEYFNDELSVSPRILFDGFKAIKSIIFNH